MFSYNIEKKANTTAFEKICAKIKANVKGITNDERLTDVDGTQIQIYYTANGTIKVYNDYEVDAVYVDSEIELNNIV